MKITRHLPKSLFIFALAVFYSAALSGEHAEDHARHGGNSRPLSEGRPVMLYFSSMKDKEHKVNIDVNKSRLLEIQNLKDCGFDVRDIEIKNIESFKRELAAGHFPPNTPVFISGSHGSPRSVTQERVGATETENIEANRKKIGAGHSPLNTTVFISGSQKSPQPDTQEEKQLLIDPSVEEGGLKGHDIPIASAITSIRDIVPGSSVYLDICYAGHARLEGVQGLGTPCSSRQISHPYGGDDVRYPVSQEMINLYCDSINGCKEIKKYDSNEDNILDGKEINQYMADKLGGKAFKVSEHSFTDWAEARSEEAKCKAAGNKFACEENVNGLNLKFSDLNPDGVKRREALELDAAAPRRLSEMVDIPAVESVDEAAYLKREFSPLLKSLLSKQWPKSSEKNAPSVLNDLVGKKVFPESYQVSESGKDIFWTDHRGTEHRYRLDDVSPVKDKPLIKCQCITKEVVTRFNNVRNGRYQETYFDPSFKLRCRK